MSTASKKRNNWFTDYQEIPGVCAGKRKLVNRGGFAPDDFRGKTVLDLGCNLGQMAMCSAEWGAEDVLGVEYDSAAFKKARSIRGKLPIGYKLDDLDNPLCWHHIQQHDTVLMLSLIDTKELDNRFGILAKACMKCRYVLYFEGHRHQPLGKYFNYILDYTDFTQIEYRGRCDGRDLYRCSRNILDADGFYETLAEVRKKYSRIAVVGNQLVGKSTLARQVTHDEFTILDDCDDRELIASCEKLVLFDYRAGLYATDFEVVFNILQPPGKFMLRRKGAKHLRSSQILPSETLCCLYTVRTH